MLHQRALNSCQVSEKHQVSFFCSQHMRLWNASFPIMPLSCQALWKLSCVCFRYFKHFVSHSIWRGDSYSQLFHARSHLMHLSERPVEMGRTSCAIFPPFFFFWSSFLSFLQGVGASVSNYAFRSLLHHELSCQAVLWTDTLHPHIALGHRPSDWWWSYSIQYLEFVLTQV